MYYMYNKYQQNTATLFELLQYKTQHMNMYALYI